MDQFSAHLDRGWDLVSRGDLAGAMLSAQKSLELDAESPEAHNLVGYIHAAEGNADGALEHYRQAIDIDETFVEAMLNAAEVLIHPLHELEDALRMIEDALDYCQNDDEVADAMLLKFDAMMHAGDTEGAARVVRALPHGPFDNEHLELLIGRARFEVGDVEGAEPLLRRSVEREPDNAEAQYYYGLLLEAGGDVRGATVAFLTSRDLDVRAGPAPWSLPPDQFEKKVQAAIHRLPIDVAAPLHEALVMVTDMPGAEVVADGVDPRIGVLLDDVQSHEGSHQVGRVFVYQRNIERVAPDLLELEDEILRTLERELRSLAGKDEDTDAEPASA